MFVLIIDYNNNTFHITYLIFDIISNSVKLFILHYINIGNKI